jgi:hypothetical protein
MFGPGSVFFQGVDIAAGGVAAVVARNGLSLDPASTLANPIVVLGDNGNNLAQLLGNRNINLNSFQLSLSDVGDPARNNAGLLLLQNIGRTANLAPFILFETNLGVEIGRMNIDTANNTFMGNQVGAGNSSGTGNTGFGWQALLANQTGSNNTAFGQGCLSTVTTQSGNTAIGSFAMANSALALNTNVAIGSNAMGGGTITGTANVGIGRNSLFALNGNQNTAIGTYSGVGATSGPSNNNVFIGFGSGYQNLGAATSADYNTFVGALIDYNTNNPCGPQNTIIGASNNQLVQIGSNNIMLGYNNAVNNVNNTTVIGDNFQTSVANIALIGKPTQNVIIGGALVGQADAGAKLQVVGSIMSNDPDTGLLDAGWLFGKQVAAAVTLNATQYISIKINGVSYKLLTAN